MKKELKRIDHKQDYILSMLTYSASDSVHILITYMQEKTPFGKAYEEAFAQYKKVVKELDKFIDKLQDTVQLRYDLEHKEESTESR